MSDLNPVAKVEGQSHSIAAVRWTLPEETVQVHSSAPSAPFKNSKSTSSRSQVSSKTPFSLSSGQDVVPIWGGPQSYRRTVALWESIKMLHRDPWSQKGLEGYFSGIVVL